MRSDQIDLEVVIQPIQVCSDNGSICSNPDMLLFEEELDKIWAQAGIDIRFLPFTQYFCSSDLVLNLEYELMPNTEISYNGTLLGSTQGEFWLRAEGANPDETVLNLWFVKDIESSYYMGGAIPGVSNAVDTLHLTCPYVLDAIFLNGMVVMDSSTTPYYQIYSIIAHELGHNLGLKHYDDPYGLFCGPAYSIPENLMSSPSDHSGTIDNIYPDGLQYEQLAPEQITMARSSLYAKPIPQNDPIQLLLELTQEVIALNIHNGITNSLDSKLDTAMGALDDLHENNNVAAINALGAFINAVEAQRDNKIPENDADDLIEKALLIILLLGVE